MVTIKEVEKHSRAARAGIRPGDILLALNGHEIADVLDYRFYLAEKKIAISLRRGEKELVKKIRKETYDDIGLCFETALMDKKHSCRNKCIFCFIDQLPKGMRESLYFKDDDARLSFLHGNYVTLTNLTDADIDRILTMHISPINVSVHTTNPELRVRMMCNKRAGEVLSYLDRLAAGGITLRGQIVLCRGVNDGAELERSMQDLSRLYPALDSVSVVPAGITDHREGLYPLTPFTAEEAAAVVRQVEAFASAHAEKTGSRLIFAADEFYLQAGLPIPPEEAYEEYPQIENGVGMLRSFYEEARLFLKNDGEFPLSGEKERGMTAEQEERESGAKKDVSRGRERRISLATGVAAAPMLTKIVGEVCEKYPKMSCNVYTIQNKWFGEHITVAGLLTGHDIAEQLAGKELGEELLLSRTTLRADGDLFLCGMTPAELSGRLGVPLRFIGEDGAEFVEALLGKGEKER